MDISTFFTYVGIVLFGLPFLLFVGLSYFMIKELMAEDETVRIATKVSALCMVIGALILVIRIMF